MLLRRMLLLVAVLMALTAVTVALSPRDRDATSPTAVAPPAASAPGDVAPSEREGQAPGESPLQTLRADASGQVVRLEPGDRLRLRVVSDELDSVQVGADGPIEAVDPDSPAEFEILAEPGLDAAVRLLEAGRTIGRVIAQP